MKNDSFHVNETKYSYRKTKFGDFLRNWQTKTFLLHQSSSFKLPQLFVNMFFYLDDGFWQFILSLLQLKILNKVF